MIEKIKEPKIVKLTCFQMSIIDKINEIIDAVNALNQEKKVICQHEWYPDPSEEGRISCFNCGAILDCDHKWEPNGNFLKCRKCGFIK